MKLSHYIFGIVLLFTHVSTGFCTPKSKLTITFDKKAALVGAPVKMLISLNNNNVKSIKWLPGDAAFSNSELLDTRERNSSTLFIHEITFTSIKPGYLKIKGLTAIVSYINGTSDTLKTPTDSVQFKSDGLIASVNNLKPISSPQSPVSTIIILSVVLIAIVVGGYFILTRKGAKPEPTKQQLRARYLAELASLETEAKTKQLSADRVYHLLTGFLTEACGLNEHDLPGASKNLDIEDGRALADIISQSEKLRFQPYPLVAGAAATYLQHVKQFISDFQSQKINQAV